MPEELRAYIRHVRQCGYCLPATKVWAEAHGFNWRSLVREGIPVSTLLEIDDVMAKKVAEQAMKETP